MSHTTNPGLLYSRFYFDDRYDEVLDGDAWRAMLNARHEAAENAKEEEHEEKQEKARRRAERDNRPFNPKAFKRARFPGASLGGFEHSHLLAPPDKKKAVDAFKDYNNHFSLRNHQLYTTQLTDAAVARNRSTYRGRGVNDFELTTDYPGLLVGLGYNHAVSAEQALNAGFSFDHTTGLPVIPGSTVKGILRAAFPQRDYTRAEEPKETKPEWYRKTAAAKAVWLTQALTKIVGPARAGATDLATLETELFDSHATPMAQPVFHDATVVGASGNLFGPDNITPHVNYAKGDKGDKVPPSRYKNPNPISMLKVMPGVSFSFAFRLPADLKLNYYEHEGEQVRVALSSAEIISLFKAIFLAFGVGAKSRLNYGRFKEETVAFPSSDQVAADLARFADFEAPAFRRDTIAPSQRRQGGGARGGGNKRDNDRQRREDQRESKEERRARQLKEQKKLDEQKKGKAELAAQKIGKTIMLVYAGKVGRLRHEGKIQ